MELDPLDELNRLALTASQIPPNLTPSPTEISLWTHLFKYTPHEASSLISAQRSDITREPITDSHWELISATVTSSGHSRESYEHLLSLKALLRSQSTKVYDGEGKGWTLFRLGGLLESEEKVRGIVGGKEVLRVSEGMGGMGESRFVWVDEGGRRKIEEWVGGMVVLR